VSRLLIGLALAACREPAAPPELAPPPAPQILVVQEAGFQVRAPSPEWLATSAGNRATLRGPRGCEGVYTSEPRPAEALEIWARRKADGLDSTLSGFDRVPFGERAAYRFEVSWAARREEVTCVFSGERAYTLVAASSAPFSQARRCFDQVRGAFEPL
jgi:hypothetical protein